MRTVLDRPKQVYPVLVVLLVGFFALSAVGQDHNNSVTWIGNTGWFAFLLTLLLTIVYSVTLLVRAMRRRSTSTI